LSKNKLPKDVIDHWPEVLDEVDIKVVPYQYLKSIEIRFVNGRTWIMDVDPESIENNEIDVEDVLNDLFIEYEDDIETVNFVLDVKKVKEDIQRRTSYFLKKKK
jgi:hypothetical protein